MTKMYGPMDGTDLMHLATRIANEIKSNPDVGDKMMMIPKGTLVAVVTELKECLNRKFFFELGKSLQLVESKEQVIKSVPPKYLADFEDGVNEKELIRQQAAVQCNTCEFKVCAVPSMRGRVFVGKSKFKKVEPEKQT